MINTFLEMAMTGFHQNRVGNCPSSNKCKKSLSINFLIKRKTLNLNFNIIFLTLTRKKNRFLNSGFFNISGHCAANTDRSQPARASEGGGGGKVWVLHRTNNSSSFPVITIMLSPNLFLMDDSALITVQLFFSTIRHDLVQYKQ